MNLLGGNDSLTQAPPTTLQPYYDRRPGLAITAAEGLSMNTGPAPSTDYVFHPAMPRIASLWGEGAVAVVQRVGYPRANLSHFSSRDIFSYGVRNGFAPLDVPATGWIARYADRYAPTPLGAVSVGLGRPVDFVGAASNPLLVRNLASFRLNAGGAGGTTQTPEHLHRLGTAKRILDRASGSAGLSSEARSALSQAHELSDQIQSALAAYTTPVTYATTAISQQMRDIAVLIQRGFETRIFYTGFGGFDTHGGQGGTTGTHATLLGRLDAAIGSFSDDLKAMGVWDTTAISVITEFGRRNYVNGSGGSDHGHGFCEILIGGAVRGGTYGPDLTEADINAEYPTYAVDFRAIYKELLRDHLGADPAAVFPEPLEIETTLGVV